MASVFVLLEAFNRKEAAALGFFPCATAPKTKALHKAAIIMKKALRFRKAIFGAPSGTRTQDPLIKSQLLSQVASSRGVENSVT